VGGFLLALIINSFLKYKDKLNLKWQGEYRFGLTWIAVRGVSLQKSFEYLRCSSVSCR